MAYRVVLTTRARADVDETAAFIRLMAPEAAARWVAGIMQAIFTLSEMPERCAVAPEAALFGRELRQLLYGKPPGIHRIIFCIEPGPDPTVKVVAVRHGARQPLGPTAD